MILFNADFFWDSLQTHHVRLKSFLHIPQKTAIKLLYKPFFLASLYLPTAWWSHSSVAPRKPSCISQRPSDLSGCLAVACGSSKPPPSQRAGGSSAACSISSPLADFLWF